MPPKSWTKLRVCGVCLLLTLPAQFADAADADSASTCSLTAAAALNLRTMPDGRITIPVKFEGRTLFFMIDTGGVASTIHPRIVQVEKLPVMRSSIPLIGADGGMLVFYIEAKDFSIGRLSAPELQLFVEPPNWADVPGTIAPAVLKNYDVEIDFAGGKFNLIYPDHCPGNVVYWAMWFIGPRPHRSRSCRWRSTNNQDMSAFRSRLMEKK